VEGRPEMLKDILKTSFAGGCYGVYGVVLRGHFMLSRGVIVIALGVSLTWV